MHLSRVVRAVVPLHRPPRVANERETFVGDPRGYGMSGSIATTFYTENIFFTLVVRQILGWGVKGEQSRQNAGLQAPPHRRALAGCSTV